MQQTPHQAPLKNTVSWEPLLRGGTSWQTRRLKQTNDHLLVVIPTGGERWLALGILLTSLLALVVLMPYLYFRGNTGLAVLTLISAPLFGLMGYAMFKSLKKLTFDLKAGTFYHDEASDPIEHELNKPKKQAFFRITEYGSNESISALVHGRIDDIAALQVILETIRVHNHQTHTKRQFSSQELNLVMQDGKRINVMDHGKLAVFEQDVAHLANFLNKPVWRHDS